MCQNVRMLECDLRPCCIPLFRGPIVLGGTGNPVKALDSKRHMPTFCDTLTPYWVFKQTPRGPVFLFFQSNFLFKQKLQVQRLLYFLFCLRKEMFLFFSRRSHLVSNQEMKAIVSTATRNSRLSVLGEKKTARLKDVIVFCTLFPFKYQTAKDAIGFCICTLAFSLSFICTRQ